MSIWFVFSTLLIYTIFRLNTSSDIFLGDKLSLASLRNSLENRKERQIQMSSGGSSSSQAVIMNQIRVRYYFLPDIIIVFIVY